MYIFMSKGVLPDFNYLNTTILYFEKFFVSIYSKIISSIFIFEYFHTVILNILK